MSTFSEPLRVEGSGYSAVVNPDGTFASLTVEPGGRELLAPGRPGNALSACTPDGGPLEPVGGRPRDARRERARPGRERAGVRWDPACGR